MPKREVQTNTLMVPASRKMKAYLLAAVEAGGFGDSVEEAAERLLWEAIRSIANSKWIGEVGGEG